MTERFVVVAGGGTAGHVHPGLAIAKALVASGRDASEVLYVGSDRGIEHELVPDAGFELVTLAGKGIPRKNPLKAARAVASIGKGVGQAVALLRREKPKVVLALGGFASVPCSLAARLLGIPVVIHEQNAVPGSANRLTSRWAKVCAVSFAGTPLPNAVVTGNPVRPEMLAVDRSPEARAAARASHGVGADQMMVAITGGSLGAGRINEAIIGALPLWSSADNVVVHHIIGPRDWESFAPRGRSATTEATYCPVRYEHDMAGVFCAADLVVSRAGASTTSEIAAVGIASILIPLPTAPGDHQTMNAQALVDAGAAVLVRDDECTSERLIAEIISLRDRPEGLAALDGLARTVGRPGAAEAVAQLLEEYAR